MTIINLTQHDATQDQLDAGVVNLIGEAAYKLKQAYRFNYVPSAEEKNRRVREIVQIAIDCKAEKALLDGPAWLTSALERELAVHEISAVYSFSMYPIIMTMEGDGTLVKRQRIKHMTFIMS